MPNNTLEKWEEKTLEEVCNINYGTRVVKNRDAGSIYPVYGGGGATFCMDTYNRENCMVVARFAMSEKCTRFVDGKFFLNDSGLTVKANISGLNQRFLDWQLIALNDKIYSFGRGSAQKNLNMDLFKKLKIRYPYSDAEQQRIVNILDVIFENIEIAKQNTYKDIDNTKELFASLLNNIFINLKYTSEIKQLSSVIEVKDGTHDSPKYIPKGEFPLITSKNLKNNQISFEKINYISKTDYNKINIRSLVEKGDVLFAMIGTIGNPVVIEINPSFAIKNVALFKKSNNILPHYLKYFLSAPITLNKMQSEANGSNQKFVSLKYLRNFPIIVPSIEEQQKIVQQLDELQEQTKKIEQIYTQKLKDLDELKQSILQKAFNGEL